MPEKSLPSIDPVGADDKDWLALREMLWPDSAREDHAAEMARVADDPFRFGQFVARDAAGARLGFAEISLRTDYVNGTESSPVAFIEGLFVLPHARRQGVAGALMAAIVAWARARGCSELASDALLDNTGSHAMHAALGFTETERVVFYRRALD